VFAACCNFAELLHAERHAAQKQCPQPSNVFQADFILSLVSVSRGTDTEQRRRFAADGWRSGGKLGHKVASYEHNGEYVEIVPSVKGLATIYDKDILIYCISQIMHKLKRLFALVRKLGHRISQPTIHGMVIRGESYSRVGLTALGLLYDDFPAHLRTLGLPTHFAEIEPRVAYYCAFRETFPAEHSANVFADPKDFTFAGLRYVQPDRHWDRYANRGPSALLDYLEFIDPPEAEV
jgi:hypothetical protein